MGKSNSIRNPLAKQIVNLHGKHGYQYNDYFRWMVDDCLASFGVRIAADQIPPEVVRPTLFELGGLYARVVQESEPFSDVLGGVYMELVSQYGQKCMGQYFTPWPVACMMASISYEGVFPEKGLIRSCDPAVGSGVMMLAFAAISLKTGGESQLKRTSFTGIDLDLVCAKIFPLQILANAFIHQVEIGELVSYHGNALGDPSELKVVIHTTSRDLDQSEILPAGHPARKLAVIDAVSNSGNELGSFVAAEQMELFM